MLAAVMAGTPLAAHSTSAPTPESAEAKRNASVHLLVIAPSAPHPALGEYVAFKQALRIGGTVHLDEALKSGGLLSLCVNDEYVDDPARLRHFLHHRWKRQHITHVLLVGDVLPVRSMVPSSSKG